MLRLLNIEAPSEAYKQVQEKIMKYEIRNLIRKYKKHIRTKKVISKLEVNRIARYPFSMAEGLGQPESTAAGSLNNFLLGFVRASPLPAALTLAGSLWLAFKYGSLTFLVHFIFWLAP